VARKETRTGGNPGLTTERQVAEAAIEFADRLPRANTDPLLVAGEAALDDCNVVRLFWGFFLPPKNIPKIPPESLGADVEKVDALVAGDAVALPAIVTLDD
jgi:hypothetical protein